MRNTLTSDLGFLSVAIGGLVYLAFVVGASVQAWSGGVVTGEIATRMPAIGSRLLGISLMFLAGFQGCSLYFLRISLHGDFTSRPWRVLPVSARALRWARWIDAFLNPGVVASLSASVVLLFTYVPVGGWLDGVTCLLAAVGFVFLTHCTFLVAAELAESLESAGVWLGLTAFAIAGAFVGLVVLGLTSGDSEGILRILGRSETDLLVHLPPWGVPVVSARHLQSGDAGPALATSLAALVGGVALLATSRRIRGYSER